MFAGASAAILIGTVANEPTARIYGKQVIVRLLLLVIPERDIRGSMHIDELADGIECVIRLEELEPPPEPDGTKPRMKGIACTFFDEQARAVEMGVKKGDKVVVGGCMFTETYQNNVNIITVRGKYIYKL